MACRPSIWWSLPKLRPTCHAVHFRGLPQTPFLSIRKPDVASISLVRCYAPRRPPRTSQYERFGNGSSWYNGGHMPPRIQIVFLIGALGSGFYLYFQETMPVTGRRRFNVVSPELEKKLVEGQFEDLLQSLGNRILPPDHPYTQQVQRVMRRLVPVSGLEKEKWEVCVIDDPDEKNAFVLPSGKVFMFSGMLPICQDDQGVAAVLAHEIAHNVAHHISERLSRKFLQLLAVVTLSLSFDLSSQSVSFILKSILELPNSRDQETEADILGLLMMANACYDPRAARQMWERMQSEETYSIPQFISTHPTNINRIKKINEWLPKAYEKHAASNCSDTAALAGAFQSTMGQQRPRQIRGPQPQKSTDDDDDWF